MWFVWSVMCRILVFMFVVVSCSLSVWLVWNVWLWVVVSVLSVLDVVLCRVCVDG